MVEKGRGIPNNKYTKIKQDKTRDGEKRKDRLTVHSNKDDVDYFTFNSFQFMFNLFLTLQRESIFVKQ